MKLNQLKTTLILLLVLIVLAGIGWWVSDTQDMAVNKKIVFQYPVEKITRFEITRINDAGKTELVKLELEKKKWKLTEPVKDDTNSITMNSIVDLFKKLEVTDTIKDFKDLAEFGLDKPTTTVKVFSGQKQAFEFLIGSETPMTYEFYAKFTDKPEIYVVPGSVRTTFHYGLDELRQSKTEN